MIDVLRPLQQVGPPVEIVVDDLPVAAVPFAVFPQPHGGGGHVFRHVLPQLLPLPVVQRPVVGYHLVRHVPVCFDGVLPQVQVVFRPVCRRLFFGVIGGRGGCLRLLNGLQLLLSVFHPVDARLPGGFLLEILISRPHVARQLVGPHASRQLHVGRQVFIKLPGPLHFLRGVLPGPLAPFVAIPGGVPFLFRLFPLGPGLVAAFFSLAVHGLVIHPRRLVIPQLGLQEIVVGLVGGLPVNADVLVAHVVAPQAAAFPHVLHPRVHGAEGVVQHGFAALLHLVFLVGPVQGGHRALVFPVQVIHPKRIPVIIRVAELIFRHRLHFRHRLGFRLLCGLRRRFLRHKFLILQRCRSVLLPHPFFVSHGHVCASLFT